MIAFAITLSSLILVGAGLCVFFTIYNSRSCPKSKRESSPTVTVSSAPPQFNENGYLNMDYLNTLSERELKSLKIYWEGQKKIGDGDLNGDVILHSFDDLRLGSLSRSVLWELYNSLDNRSRSNEYMSYKQDDFKADAIRVKSYIADLDRVNKCNVNLQRINSVLTTIELLKEEPTKWTELDSTESKEVPVAAT